MRVCAFGCMYVRMYVAGVEWLWGDILRGRVTSLSQEPNDDMGRTEKDAL